jgi:putative endonuclease
MNEGQVGRGRIDKKAEPPPEYEWFVYLIEAENGFLYTGITTDLDRRIKEHKEGKKGAKFFRRSPPKRFLVRLGPYSRSIALKLEHRIKQLKREEKLKLKVRRNLKSLLDSLS